MISSFSQLRDLQTAGIRCKDLLSELEQLYPKIATRGTAHEFGPAVFIPAWEADREAIDGDEQIESLLRNPDPDYLSQTDEATRKEWGAMFIAVAYCVQAIKAEQIDRNPTLAWGYAFDAAHWAGTLAGIIAGKGGEPAARQRIDDLAAAWHLRDAPVRDDGLSGVLHETLKRLRESGEPRPKARDVFKMWVEDKPPGLVSVAADHCVFFNSTGREEKADHESLSDRIKRMTQRPK